MFPSTITKGIGKNKIQIPFNEGTEWEKKQAVTNTYYSHKNRISMGKNFIADLQRVMDSFHGEALKEVSKAPAPETIVLGEQRVTTAGMTLTCVRINGARIYWKSGVKQGWTGSTSWRKFKRA